jgi:hypothetical protein
MFLEAHMRVSLLLSLFAGVSLFSAPAFAQEEEEDEDEIDFSDDTFDLDDFSDDEEDEDIVIERLDDGDDLESEDEIDDEDYGGDSETEDLDFGNELDELGDDEIGQEGSDNVQIYRQFIDDLDDLGPEEEIISWERYLDKYPNTLFRDRIDTRIDELNDEIYGERIEGDDAGYKDAKDRELNFATPILLESFDPRSKARVAFQVGFPQYISGLLDFEYQLARPWSVHAGVAGRYTGFNIELGTRYSPIKSARMNLLVTGILDVHYNTLPGFVGVRPQVAAAKIFDVGGGLHVGAIGGLDMELGRAGNAGFGGMTRYIGGAHIYYDASDVVGVFAEASLNLKASGEESLDPFSFNVVSFGLKFQPPKVPASVGLNANVPAQYNYWGYHAGAVQADLNWYLDDYVEPVF